LQVACKTPFETYVHGIVGACANWNGRDADLNLIEQAKSVLINSGVRSQSDFNSVDIRWCPLNQASGMTPVRDHVLLVPDLKGDLAQRAIVLGHEMKHIEQFRRWGADDFECRYSQQLPRGTGRDNSVEEEAYAFQDQITPVVENYVARALGISPSATPPGAFASRVVRAPLGISQQGRVAQARRQFLFFNGNNPNDASSRREWRRIDEDTWREVYPTGQVTTLKRISQATLNNVNGTIWRKTDDPNQEVFLPDAGSGDLHLLWRSSGGSWNSVGDIRDSQLAESETFIFFNGNNPSDSSSKRVWRRLDSGTWEEKYPSGSITVLKLIENTEVDHVYGTVWRKTDDPSQEVFLPASASGSVKLLWRQGEQTWHWVGDIRDD
jgi:hypothetical protein